MSIATNFYGDNFKHALIESTATAGQPGLVVVNPDGSNVGGGGGGTTDVNLIELNGNAVSAGNGDSGTGVLRVAQVSDGTGVLGLNAGTALIGKVSAGLDASNMYSGATALTTFYAVIGTSTSGASQVVAAVTSKNIVVLEYVLVANAAVNVKFQSHVTPTDLTGLLYLAANTGVSASFSPVGLFKTIAGEALDINLSGAIAVGGHIVYVTI